MSLEAMKQLPDEADRARSDAIESLKHIPQPTLDRLAKFVETQYLLEISLCSTHDDLTKLRQSQGAARAYQSLFDVITHRPIEQRRTTSRPEV